MSPTHEWCAIDEPALVEVAAALASLVGNGGVILLQGELGAGKTTFARALLGKLGVGERIKSPTYSLIETYQLVTMQVHHLDLYRIADAEELEWLGLPDLVAGPSLMMIEWPERGEGALPPADLRIQLAHVGERRNLRMTAVSALGQAWLKRLSSCAVDSAHS